MPVGSEEDRLRYLKQFGINLWYPREALRNALPSPDYFFPLDVKQANPGELKEEKLITSQQLKVDSVQPFRVAADQAAPTGASAEMPISDLIGSMSTAHESINSPATVVYSERQAPEEPNVSTKANAQLFGGWASPAEVWCKSAWVGGTQTEVSQLVILAKLNASSYTSEHQLLQNIVRVLYRFTGSPIFREFYWPPFDSSNIPFQNESAKAKLLKRWVSEMDWSCLVIFNDHVIHGLESAIYCPSLSELLEEPSRKHEAWNALQHQLLTA